MVAVFEQVESASLSVNDQVISTIGFGAVIYLGVSPIDTLKEAEFLAQKIVKTRCFVDQNDKINLNILDVDGQVLVVSNFSLLADLSHGNRPSFTTSASGDIALPLYEHFVKCLKDLGVKAVKTGVFGEHMVINAKLVGPLNFILNTATLLKK